MMKFALVGLCIGLLTGVIAALCGVGGGIFMVPAFVQFLGLTQKQAVATSLAVIVPTALSATVVNARNDLVVWPVLLATSLGAVVTSWLMAEKLKSLSDATLTRIFAVVVVVMGVRMWFAVPGDQQPTSQPSTGNKAA